MILANKIMSFTHGPWSKAAGSIQQQQVLQRNNLLAVIDWKMIKIELVSLCFSSFLQKTMSMDDGVA